MYYRVTARLRTETGVDFLRNLTDGTIESQSPDGRKIVDAINRAVLTDDGNVLWSEVCYYLTRLAHERATVFDKHLEALETDVVEGYHSYDGRRFMEYVVEFVEAK
jgi:hypothetical protein